MFTYTHATIDISYIFNTLLMLVITLEKDTVMLVFHPVCSISSLSDADTLTDAVILSFCCIYTDHKENYP